MAAGRTDRWRIELDFAISPSDAAKHPALEHEIGETFIHSEHKSELGHSSGDVNANCSQSTKLPQHQGVQEINSCHRPAPSDF
jgi:hypothetical protein